MKSITARDLIFKTDTKKRMPQKEKVGGEKPLTSPPRSYINSTIPIHNPQQQQNQAMTAVCLPPLCELPAAAPLPL